MTTTFILDFSSVQFLRIAMTFQLFGLVWLFVINRTTIPRICFCSEPVCVLINVWSIVDLDIVGMPILCAGLGHIIYLFLLVII